jgi:uncharacterized repeat protein (TIGR01451 family)
MTRALVRLATVALLSVASLTAVPGPAVARALADGGTCQSLAQLGAGTVERGPITATIPEVFGVDVTLPAGAAQGPSTWYLFRLHIGVDFAAGSTGTAVVSAATNGRTVAQVQLTSSGTEVEWSTVSAAEPARVEKVPGRSAEVTMTNYPQRAGVQGGRNRLTFTVEVADGAVVERVRFFGDTCIEPTTRSPESLEVSSRYAPTAVRAGEELTLFVRVRNAGTTPLGEVRIRARPPAAGLQAVSGTSQVRRDLTGEWIAELRYRATTPGKYTVRVDIGTGISPFVGDNKVAVEVREAAPPVAPWLIGAAVVLVLAMLVGHRFLRRRR